MSGRIHVWLKRLFVPGGSLSERVVRGGFWVFALRIVDRLFRLARTIVLARLLAPEDFGLFGIALLAMSALETFSQTGFQPALVQKKGDIAPYLDTAWTVQALRGAVLAVVLLGISPYVAIFFATPAATGLVRVLGLSVLFRGFANIGVVYFQKELEFHKQFIYELSGTLVDLVVAIAAALLLRNAWALILGLLAGNVVRMAFSYLIHPYRARPRLDGAQLGELHTFGRWVWGSTTLIFLVTQGDDVFLGKVLGPTALGLYQMAFTISNLPSTEVTRVISQVSLPTYAKLQSELAGLRRAYLQTLKVTALMAFPLAGSILLLASDVTRTFLGDQWIDLVPAMQVLSLFGLIRSFGGTTGPLFNGVGRPDILARLAVLQLLLLAITIYPLTAGWGITGTAWATVVANLVTQVVAGIQLIRLIRVDFSALLLAVGVPLVGTISMVQGMVLADRFLVQASTFPGLLVTFCSGLVVYFCVVVLLNRFLSWDLESMLLTIKQAIR